MDNPDLPLRRGRLPRSELAARKLALLEVTRAALVDLGYSALTMADVASRANASKETLYSWFGSKVGLINALIEHDGDASAQRLADSLHDPTLDLDSARTVLTDYAEALLTLLTGPSSIALNRAAASDPALAATLLTSGRHRVGPIVADYLRLLDDAGVIHAPDAEEAFEVLYGLVVRDSQIRVLLGEPSPSKRIIRARGELAVSQFLRLTTR